MENDIKQVDAEIEKLTERKSQLKKKREELKQRQNEEYSKKLASEDWETGGLIIVFRNVLNSILKLLS